MGMKSCAKICLVVFNSIFFLLGGLCLGLGIWVLVDKASMLTLTRMTPISSVNDSVNVIGLLEGAAYGFIAGGGAVFIIAFLGCCGAIKEIKIFLYIYAFLVFLILGAEIAAGVVAYFFKDKVESELKTFLNSTIVYKYEGLTYNSGSVLSPSSDILSVGWDAAHVGFDCCGMNNHTDFTDYATVWNNKYNFTYGGSTYSISAKVPVSCCKIVDKSKFPGDLANLQFVNISECLTNPTDYTTNTAGCYPTIRSWLVSNSILLLGVGIGVGVVEICGIIFACCLARAKSNDDDDD